MSSSSKKEKTKILNRNMENFKKKVAIFDLDGTLVNAHVWLGILKHNLKTKENLFTTIGFITSHLALTPFWKLGFLSKENYYKSWGKDIAQMIKGIKPDKAKEVFSHLSDNYLLPTLKKRVLQRLKEHQKDGFLTILISGSFQNLLEIIADRLGVDFAVGTKLEVVGDKFSGRIIPPFCFGQKKVELSKKFFTERNLNINFEESFAYSDSVFDLPLLKLVGKPVAVDPDKELFVIANNRGWEIIS